MYVILLCFVIILLLYSFQRQSDDSKSTIVRTLQSSLSNTAVGVPTDTNSSIISKNTTLNSTQGIQLNVNYQNNSNSLKNITEEYASLRPRTNNRTAVCISGQLRSGNLSWNSGRLRKNDAYRMFGPDDPPTPIQTVLEWLLKPIAIHGGVDVFMYIQAHPETNMSTWDGDPFTFEPVIGDTTVCEPYLKHPIFHPSTGNKLFCLVEEEIQLMTPFLKSNPMWISYSYHPKPSMEEQALQQYYGMYRANQAAKQYALANNVTYTYKVRLRPDIAVVKPIPSLEIIPFFHSNAEGKCNSTIFYGNKVIYKNGAEDTFNIGLAEDMDKVLDRYRDFTETPFIRAYERYFWDLEYHLIGLITQRYNICLQSHNDIWIVILRKSNHQNEWIQPTNPNQWIQIN